MKKRFSEEQIIGFLKQADAGMPVKELCRQHGFSDASYYLWRSKYGGMEVSDARRLKALEAENARLKKLLAEAMLEREVSASVITDEWVAFVFTQPPVGCSHVAMPSARQCAISLAPCRVPIGSGQADWLDTARPFAPASESSPVL